MVVEKSKPIQTADDTIKKITVSDAKVDFISDLVYAKLSLKSVKFLI